MSLDPPRTRRRRNKHDGPYRVLVTQVGDPTDLQVIGPFETLERAKQAAAAWERPLPEESERGIRWEACAYRVDE